MIPVSRVSQVQRLDACLALLPPKPLRVRVTILVLVSFFASQSKEYAKRKLKSWLGGLHPHVIFTCYDNLSSLNILKYLDHLLLQKMKYFLQGNRFQLELTSFSRKCN